jgi:hypothetical protein
MPYVSAVAVVSVNSTNEPTDVSVPSNALMAETVPPAVRSTENDMPGNEVKKVLNTSVPPAV